MKKHLAAARALSGLALAIGLAAQGPVGLAEAATWRCRTTDGLRTPVHPSCEEGMPVVVGEFVLVPRACRLELEGKAIVRHTVELRDTKTATRRGQTSLPPMPAPAGTDLPAVGAILGGPFPLFVWPGGIATVDVALRKMEVVLEPTHRLVAIARLGEVLSVVEAMPADERFTAGSLHWTVLDFGSAKVLGELRVAGQDLRGLGIEPMAGRKHPVWLQMHGTKGLMDLVAQLDATGADDGAPAPGIVATAVAPRDHVDLHGSDWSAGTPAAGTCAALTGRDAILTATPPARIRPTPAAPVVPGRSRGTVQMAGCLIASVPDAEGTAWGWILGPSGPVLSPLRCEAQPEAPAAGTSPGTPPASAAPSKEGKPGKESAPGKARAPTTAGSGAPAPK